MSGNRDDRMLDFCISRLLRRFEPDCLVDREGIDCVCVDAAWVPSGRDTQSDACSVHQSLYV